jgi:hypothetical protein
MARHYDNMSHSERELAMNHLNLTVHFDAGYDGWIVREASHAYSMSYVPVKRTKNGKTDPVTYYFETKAEAYEQVRRLKLWVARGGQVEFKNTNTPELFEAVADSKYGVAWN